MDAGDNLAVLQNCIIVVNTAYKQVSSKRAGYMHGFILGAR